MSLAVPWTTACTQLGWILTSKQEDCCLKSAFLRTLEKWVSLCWGKAITFLSVPTVPVKSNKFPTDQRPKARPDNSPSSLCNTSGHNCIILAIPTAPRGSHGFPNISLSLHPWSSPVWGVPFALAYTAAMPSCCDGLYPLKQKQTTFPLLLLSGF